MMWRWVIDDRIFFFGWIREPVQVQSKKRLIWWFGVGCINDIITGVWCQCILKMCITCVHCPKYLNYHGNCCSGQHTCVLIMHIDFSIDFPPTSDKISAKEKSFGPVTLITGHWRTHTLKMGNEKTSVTRCVKYRLWRHDTIYEINFYRPY